MTKDGPKMGCENGKLFLGEPLARPSDVKMIIELKKRRGDDT
jgi:hypothetical protein